MSNAFHPLKIVDVARETDDAISLTLEPPREAAGAFMFTPGQHLTLRADIGGEDVRRTYSLCTAPGDGPMRVAIKQVPGGRFSSWALESLKAGGAVEAMAPRGHFTWTFARDAKRHYLAIAAGSGITPVLSLIKTGLAREPASRFTLLYGNRSSSSIMFLEELASLKDRYLGRLQVCHFLTAEFDDIELFNGRLDAARFDDLLASLIDPAGIGAAFVCGPAAMMNAAETALLAAGVEQANILTERFQSDDGEAERPADKILREQAEGQRFEVRMDGRRRAILFDAGRGNILESARAAGLAAPFACKAGVCATCRAKLVAGEVQMRKNYGLSAEEVEQGYILTCQSIPKGEGVVIDYDG
jgi:ring-1,2-phenylacetyl-CoA epoxidase subunit PaaE